MRTNFTECAADYLGNQALINQYGWTGAVVGIHPNRSAQVSLEGCKHICGTGNDYYPWKDAANTITTWLLPIVGILLQAPFVSNAFWETCFSLARWVGSPMASLSYVLWNIKVTGKGALLVDLACRYDEPKDVEGAEEGDFGSMRDSMYILTAMNQYSMSPNVQQKKEAEGLLRIALFSKDLRLLKTDKAPLSVTRPDDDLEPENYLNKLRHDLARDMRLTRKRGAVPVFISILWFLFALALSIQSAFGQLGGNAEAHDLALGCLLAWLPVLILGTIVDRNPVSADDLKKSFNDLIDRVRNSLMDETIRSRFVESIDDPDRRHTMEDWVATISQKAHEMDRFFTGFAGQGRKRWFYGCAHPILTDIEAAYIASRGRNWLADERKARTSLVLGKVDEGLDWLDYREIWQIVSAVLIVGGTIFGAFILSFFTPTVGLGCRSGGYTIFGVIAFGLLFVEMILWWIIDATKPRVDEWIRRISTTELHNARWQRLAVLVLRCRDTLTCWIPITGQKARAEILNPLSKRVPTKLAVAFKDRWAVWPKYNLQQKLDRAFFKPIECLNTVWLIYITLAQTFGAYTNCECMSSIWGGSGGYIDFTQYDTTSSPYVKLYWTSGATLSSVIMAVGMIYIVVEWCIQSHLSTSDFPSAMIGLQRTRRYRRSVNWISIGWYKLTNEAYKLMQHILSWVGIKISQRRQRVIWTKDVRPIRLDVSPGFELLRLPTFETDEPLLPPDAAYNGEYHSISPRSSQEHYAPSPQPMHSRVSYGEGYLSPGSCNGGHRRSDSISRTTSESG